MKKFEYKTVFKTTIDVTLVNMGEYLNSEGEQGWELVYIVETPFIQGSGIANRDFVFKREKSETK